MLTYGDEASGHVTPPYVARGHPVTNAVIERHTQTVHRMHGEGISTADDKDDMLLKMVLYDDLPPRPDGDEDTGRQWDAADPLTHLGKQVGKRLANRLPDSINIEIS